MFYLTWKSQLDYLSDKELRRFINNLIAWHQGEKIDLKSKSDVLVWNGVLPALESNDEKWNSRAGTSRENGKLGGRPNKVLTQETQQVNEKPKKPVKSKELKVKSEEKIVESKEETGNMIIVNTGMTQGEFLRSKIERAENILVDEYSHYPFLLSMANPTGIKELKNHIEKKEEIDSITSLLKELSESRYKLRGNYD